MKDFSSKPLNACEDLMGTEQKAPSVEDVHSLIIVARDQPELCRALRRQLAADPKVLVFPDRRRWERRRLARALAFDQRGPDRRRPPSLEHDVSQRSFVIIRQQEGVVEV